MMPDWRWLLGREDKRRPDLSNVRKAEKEIAEFRRFQTLAQELVQVSQKICRLRPLAAEELSPGKKKRRKPSNRKSAEK